MKKKHIKKMFKGINRLSELILFGILSFITVSGQQEKIDRDIFMEHFVFKANHIEFNLSTLSVLKARIKREIGEHPFSSKPALGLLLSFKYHLNFTNNYSLITGPEAMALGRNFLTSFNKNDFSPPLIKNYKLKGFDTYVPVLVLSIPVLVQRRWQYVARKYFFTDVGARINFSTGADFDFFSITLQNTGNGFYNAGGTDLVANNNSKPWLSYPLSIGHGWLLKNNNILQLGLCSNFSLTKYINGRYRILIPRKPTTEGKYSSTGSYIGVSLNYVFTNANYHIRKEYEKKGHQKLN